MRRTMKLTPKRLVADLRRKHSAEVAMLMEEDAVAVKEVAPTGMAVLDRYLLGVGGFPYGRAVTLAGMEGTGKTTLMDVILAGAQRDGAIAVLAESEDKWDPQWAAKHGLDLKSLVFVQPACIEEFVSVVGTICDRAKTQGQKAIVALDSVASLPSEEELENGLDKASSLASQARVWSTYFRVMTRKLRESDVGLLMTNQIRSKVGVMYGNPETEPGGNAIRFYTTIRMHTFHGKLVDGKSGRIIDVQTTKNQLCPPFRRAQFRLDFHDGFRDRWSILNHAKDVGCVAKGCRSYKEAATNLGWDDLLTTATKDDDGGEE